MKRKTNEMSLRNAHHFYEINSNALNSHGERHSAEHMLVRTDTLQSSITITKEFKEFYFDGIKFLVYNYSNFEEVKKIAPQCSEIF